MTYTPIPDHTRRKVLEALLSDRTPTAIATIAAELHLEGRAVRRIADAAGWPDRAKVSFALEALRDADLPLRTPAPHPDQLETRIADALASKHRDVRRAAQRVVDALTHLDRALADADRAERIREQARAEIRDLEEKLAAARRRLTDPLAAPTHKAKADLKRIRTWAHENNIDCPDRGRIPQRVLDAYTDAHRS
jgi:hypothetical protein